MAIFSILFNSRTSKHLYIEQRVKERLMNITNYLIILVALLSVPLVISIKAACLDETTFRTRPLSSHNGMCNWGRGNNHCNIDSDCCPGQKCNAFGICKDCR